MQQLNRRHFVVKSASSRLRDTVVTRIGNHPGALENVLRVLRENNVNLTRIESRPTSANSSWDVFLDCEYSTIPFAQLKEVCVSVDSLGPKDVPWFPRQESDLDSFSHKILDAGSELSSDHPGFTDHVYRERRNQIVHNARNFRFGLEIPRVSYSKQELDTWKVVYEELKNRFPSFACKEYVDVLEELESLGLYSSKSIPQLQDLSPWLESKTGFKLRPVGGLLSARDFLNGLAIKTFHSTQYIRHPSKPFYTPEPDVVHELMGHVPMLGIPEFAALSHDIGLASLGASDSDVNRLATLYWFSVEFGLVMENNQRKAYGAGLLSSFGELEFACKEAKVKTWDPDIACDTLYPVTTFQPLYFVAPSLASVAESTRLFCNDTLKRPFYAKFEDGEVQTVDRDVRRRSK